MMAPLVARIDADASVLPLNTYTAAYWKIDLHNLLHFLGLRLDTHAQKEIRIYAEAIVRLIEPFVPVTMEAFRDFQLNSMTLSGPEIQTLKALVASGHRGGPMHSGTGDDMDDPNHPTYGVFDPSLVDFLPALGKDERMTSGEAKEFAEKLRGLNLL